MTRLETTVAISAPADRVWRVLADVRRWREWTPSITRIEPLGEPDLAVGHRFRILQPKLRPAVWTVTELDPGQGFTWVSRAPGIDVVASHAIRSAVSDACTVTLRVAFSGPFGRIVGWFGRTLTWRYMELEGAGLKRRAEEIR